MQVGEKIRKFIIMAEEESEKVDKYTFRCCECGLEVKTTLGQIKQRKHDHCCGVKKVNYKSITLPIKIKENNTSQIAKYLNSAYNVKAYIFQGDSKKKLLKINKTTVEIGDIIDLKNNKLEVKRKYFNIYA